MVNANVLMVMNRKQEMEQIVQHVLEICTKQVQEILSVSIVYLIVQQYQILTTVVIHFVGVAMIIMAFFKAAVNNVTVKGK